MERICGRIPNGQCEEQFLIRFLRHFGFVAEVITTVGLGDVWPKTVPGKILSFMLMLFGLFDIALPSIVLGNF